ncbi:MAG: hypothetical protein ABIP51_13955 [Bacteroidia bacterium]
MKKIIYLFCLIFILAIQLSAQKTKKIEPVKISIEISTTDTSIKFNGEKLISYQIYYIEKMLGKADRIKTHTFKSYYEEFGDEDTKPTSTPITVTDYYYIYDQLGLMFYTNNGWGGTKDPKKFSVHFKNKRFFTNTAALPFTPLNTFTGILKINKDTVSADKKMITQSVTYKTNEINLFKIGFGLTSIATVIDGLYSNSVSPYLLMYLDSEKEQRLSYIVVH